MKLKNYTYLLALIAVLYCNSSFSQTTKPLPITADSLASGNYKDVLKSFFQLAFNRLTSKDKELEFSSNPFAVMAKMNNSLLIDTSYIKYRHLRNLNFSFAGKLDSAYKFNGFTSTIKYALVNKRDETVSRAYLALASNANSEYDKLNTKLDQEISRLNIDDPKRTLFTTQKDLMTTGAKNFNELDPDFQKFVKEKANEINNVYLLKLVEEDPKVNLLEASKKTYNSVKDEFNKKLLVTIALSDTTYKDQFLFSNMALTTHILQGLSKSKTRVGAELDIKLAAGFMDDTLRSGRDLKRNILNFEPGINLVFRNRETGNSWGEFKLSGAYTHGFNGLYPGETRDVTTLNGTLRIRIINDIWIPFEIKYDPENGNVFGFLNVRGNFTGLKNLFKEQAR